MVLYVTIVVGILFILFVIYGLEGMTNRRDPRRLLAAKKIAALRPMFKSGNDTLARTRMAHKDTDVVEYFDIRNILENCDDDCIDDIHDAID